MSADDVPVLPGGVALGDALDDALDDASYDVLCAGQIRPATAPWSADDAARWDDR